MSTGARQETHRREVKGVVTGKARDTAALKAMCGVQRSSQAPCQPVLI